MTVIPIFERLRQMNEKINKVSLGAIASLFQKHKEETVVAKKTV